MTYPPQQPQGDWGGQQPYDPAQQGYGYQPGFQPQDPYAPPQDPYGQPQDPYGQAPNPYAPPQDPYGQPQDPYAQPQDPYAQPPADPMQQYSAPPVSATLVSGQAWPGGPGGPGGPMLPPQAPKSGPPVWLFIVGGVVLLALIGAGVLFAFNMGSDNKPSDDKSDSADGKSDEPSDDTTNSSQPDGDLTEDPGTGLSYETMENWNTLDPSLGVPVKNFTTMEAQSYPVSSDWIALFGVGEVSASSVDYEDSGDLKDAVKNLAEDYDNHNFGETPPKGIERDEKAEYTEEKLGSADAVIMSYHLTWDEGVNPDTGEQVVFAAIDAGDGKLAGFIGSLPDSTPKEQVDAAVEASKSLALN